MNKPSLTIKVLRTSLLLILSLISPLVVSATIIHDSSIHIELNPNDYLGPVANIQKFEIKPSQNSQGVLTIKNGSANNSLTLKLYAVDSIKSINGDVGFKLEEQPQELLGKWITFSKTEVNVEANQEINVPYTITIPEKITPGTYQGGLVTEILRIGNVKREITGQVKVVNRAVDSIIVSIPGRKILTYSLDSFQKDPTTHFPTFQLSFRNTGNVILKSIANISITGTLLNSPYRTSLNNTTILQGDSLNQNYTWDNCPYFGKYQAKLNLKIYQYNIATGELNEVDTLTKEVEFIVVPWLHLLILLITIIIVSIVFYYIGKRAKAQAQIIFDSTFIHTVKAKENIISIAKLYQVDWKKLAQLNKLQKPYFLRTGKNLIVPYPQAPQKAK